MKILQLLSWPFRKVLIALADQIERLKIGLMASKNRSQPEIRLLRSVSKKASIVIPNYNGKKYLGDCIDALYRIDFPRESFEVIVVDNASSDNSCEFIRATYPDVMLIRAERNLGFASGCNLGIQNSSGEYIVLLNNDTVVDTKWLGELITVAENDRDVGIVGSKLVYKEDPTRIQNAMSYITTRGDGGDLGMGQPDEGQYDFLREGMAICGASMLIRRTLIQEIGALDDDFFAYYEDTDLCYRMRLYGKKIVFAPKSVVHHVHSATSGEWSPMFTFLVLRNKLLLHLKNSPVGFLLKVLFLYGRQVIYEGLVKGANRKIHLKVILSFAGKLPKFLGKRIYIRAIVKRRSDDRVLLRLSKAKLRVDAAAVKKVCVYNAYLPTMGGGENLTAHTIAYINSIFPSASVDILCHETRAFGKSRFAGKEFVQMLEKEFELTLKNTAVRYVNFDFNIHNFIGNLRYIFQLSSISKEYDMFINNTFISLVPARAGVNIYYCMFPFRLDYPPSRILGPLRRRFYNGFLASYDLFLSISQFTQNWVDRYWEVNSHVLYPAVKTKRNYINPHKENMIINVGRFFAGGHNKKQDVLLKAFIKMYDQGWARDWKLVLVGRKHTDEASNSYILTLEETVKGYPIDLCYNTEADELQSLLDRAKIYWHATGFEEASNINPEKFEHFGLSTIEAAQFGAVPVVFNGGGQPEIIKHAQNGYLWDTIDELIHYSKLLMESNSAWEDLSRATVDSMRIFSTEQQLRWFIMFLSAYYKFDL